MTDKEIQDRHNKQVEMIKAQGPDCYIAYLEGKVDSHERTIQYLQELLEERDSYKKVRELYKRIAGLIKENKELRREMDKTE